MNSTSSTGGNSQTGFKIGTDTVLAVDTSEAARITGLSKTWLEQLRSKGLGPKWAKIGKRALYRPADLDAWVAEHVREPKAA